MDAFLLIAVILVIVAGVLALADMFSPRPRLLHIAVLLLAVAVLMSFLTDLNVSTG